MAVAGPALAAQHQLPSSHVVVPGHHGTGLSAGHTNGIVTPGKATFAESWGTFSGTVFPFTYTPISTVSGKCKSAGGCTVVINDLIQVYNEKTTIGQYAICSIVNGVDANGCGYYSGAASNSALFHNVTNAQNASVASGAYTGTSELYASDTSIVDHHQSDYVAWPN
jgi:hypothetical protein